MSKPAFIIRDMGAMFGTRTFQIIVNVTDPPFGHKAGDKFYEVTWLKKPTTKGRQLLEGQGPVTKGHHMYPLASDVPERVTAYAEHVTLAWVLRENG